MARLFISPREIDLISDLTKEITKDVIGQKIYYYKVREDLTDIHDVYEEAPNKVFDPPIDINALISWGPGDITTGKFGSEQRYSLEVDIQSRDILDRDLDIESGDFFSYGDTFYEVIKTQVISQIFGQIEHSTGVKLTGKQARQGLIDFTPIGPTDESYDDPDAVEETFVQQRGFEENELGPTGDIRSLRAKDVLMPPITGPKQVSPKGGDGKKGEAGFVDSAFYGDE